MKFFITLLFVFSIFGAVLPIVPNAQAQSGVAADINRQLDAGGMNTGLTPDDPRETVAFIIKAFLGLLGIIAVALMLYAGFLWMTAGGNSEQVGTAKSIIINATIGLAVLLSAYTITYAVFRIALGSYAF
jgi:hypothetical protein